MVPGAESAEGEEPDAGSQGLKFESSIDAIIKGTMDGMQLIAVIIVVFALVSFADQLLALLPMVDGEPLSLKWPSAGCFRR